MKRTFQLILVQLFTWLADSQRSTYTEWRTISSTVHFTSNFVCADLVHVTGRCRQRRGFTMEQPVILMMDGLPYPETNEFNQHSQLIPTQTLRVEATPLIVLPDWPVDYQFHSPINIEPSIPRISGRKKQLGYFSRINNFFKPMVSINVTITNVFTHTLTRTTIRTASFFLMGCTPSPLLYTTCPASSAEITNPLLIAEDERKLFQFHRWKNKKKKRPITFTVTHTSTLTALMTSSTIGLCAQLVNVTGPCRLRRGFRMEDPIVLSFDEDMDSIDSILSPSKTQSIEPTGEPIEGPVRWVHDGASRFLFVSDPKIRSSGQQPEEWEEADTQRLVFHDIFGWKMALSKRIKFVTIVTSVVTVTSTSIDNTTVSTKTFFVQICTPSPFPFDVCARIKTTYS